MLVDPPPSLSISSKVKRFIFAFFLFFLHFCVFFFSIEKQCYSSQLSFHFTLHFFQWQWIWPLVDTLLGYSNAPINPEKLLFLLGMFISCYKRIKDNCKGWRKKFCSSLILITSLINYIFQVSCAFSPIQLNWCPGPKDCNHNNEGTSCHRNKVTILFKTFVCMYVSVCLYRFIHLLV